jgi:hypothetical protein
VATIAASRGPTGIAVNRRLGTIYVTEASVEGLLVIDGNRGSPTLHSVVATVSIPHRGMWPTDVAVHPVTDRVYAYVWGPMTGDWETAVATIAGGSHDLLSLTVLSAWVHRNLDSLIVPNPLTDQVYVASTEDANTVTVLRDSVPFDVTTPATTGSQPVTVTSERSTITFSDVTTRGTTTVEPIAASELTLSIPGQFSLDGATAYEVSTTADIVGPIVLCFKVGPIDDAEVFASLRVLHGEDGELVDRTSSRDFAAGTVCAQVDSLSPFVIAMGARGAVRKLTLEVDALKAAGELTPLQHRILGDTLDASVNHLDNGRTILARVALRAFVAELRVLVRLRRLAATVAEPLIAKATEIIAVLH